MGCIYLITNNVNGKKYIGQTIYTACERFKEHSSSKDEYPIHCAIRKYGLESFELAVLEDSLEVHKLDEREIYHISNLNTLAPKGYNLTLGGGGIKGYRHTEITKLKIGEKTKMLDYKSMKERNLKISKYWTGRKRSLENRKKCSDLAKLKVGELNPFYGKKHTGETKKFISNMNTGRVSNRRKSIVAYGKDCEVVFESVSHAYDWLLKNEKTGSPNRRSVGSTIRREGIEWGCKRYGYYWKDYEGVETIPQGSREEELVTSRSAEHPTDEDEEIVHSL